MGGDAKKSFAAAMEELDASAVRGKITLVRAFSLTFSCRAVMKSLPP